MIVRLPLWKVALDSEPGTTKREVMKAGAKKKAAEKVDGRVLHLVESVDGCARCPAWRRR